MSRLVLAVVLVSSLIPQSAKAQACLTESEDPRCNDGKLVNGYWWRDFWVPAMPDVKESWFLPAPIWSKGNAVFYNCGAMSATAKYRGLSLKGYVDGVALMSPADIGLTVWVRPPRRGWEKMLVVDAAAGEDIYGMVVHTGEIAEVSCRTAKRWGMLDRNGDIVHWRFEDVEVSKVPPYCLYEYNLISYPKWWLAHFVPVTKGYEIYRPLFNPEKGWRIDGKWTKFEPPKQYCQEDWIKSFSDFFGQ